MAKASGFKVKINLDTREYKRNLASISNEMQRKFGHTWVSLSSRLASKLKYLGLTMGVVAGASMKLGAEFEKQQVAFTRMLGSVEAATSKLSSLQDFASRTPFRFVELVEYEKKLIAMGFAAENIETLLTSLGDAASALGMGSDGLERLIKAISSIKSKGLVQTKEMRQLAEVGIPAWEILAKGIGTTIEQTMELVQKRAISGADGIFIILEGMNQRFSGMMDKQSRTVLGLLSNIQGEAEAVAIAFGRWINEVPAFKGSLESILESMQELRREISIIGVSDTISSLLSGKLGTALLGIAGVITGVLIPALVALTYKLSLIAWPYIAIGLVTTAIGTLAALIYKNFDKIKLTAMNVIDYIYNLAFKGWLKFAKTSILFFASIVGQITSDLLHKIGLISDSLANELHLTFKIMERNTINEWKNFKLLDVESLFDPLKKEALETKIFLTDLFGASLLKKLFPDNGQDYFKAFNRGWRLYGEPVITSFTQPYTSFLKNITGQGKMGSLFNSLKKPEDKPDEEPSDEFYQKALRELRALNKFEESFSSAFEKSSEDFRKKIVKLSQLKREQEQDNINFGLETGDWQLVQENLNKQYIAHKSHVEGVSALYNVQYKMLMEASRTSASYMAEAYETAYNSLSNGITELIVAGKSFGETMKNLGNELVAMVVKWMIQRKVASAFSKRIGAVEMASSVALGKSIATGWAGAASMVSLATFGANSAAAMAGMTATSAMAKSMAFLAEGGIVTKPTLAMIGEGGESEAVIPLSKLSNFTGKSNVVVNVNNSTPANVRTESYFDGTREIINLFIDGYSRNVSGIKDLMRG